MGVVQVSGSGPMTNGLAELNHHMGDEFKEIRNEVTGEGNGLSEEYESRINEDGEGANDGCRDTVQIQVHPTAVLQRSQKQPQGSLVCQERLLLLRSLKVLLVENDDSTRRVLCALLQNCGYEVIAVENGLQAWKTIEDLDGQIDFVLTEVVMPCLSGMGLLCKIMSHKTWKNIPVIMMSSHDSMSIVFNCLSKGAVYFLVKPIRKNELQNLWHHVLRKCHRSSGSGSESGIMTQRSTKSKNVQVSDKYSGSSYEDDTVSTGLNIQYGSDNGSGTKSSWTKRVAEVESPKGISQWEQLSDPPDCTYAQVIDSRPEEVGNSWVPMTVTKESEKQDDELENVVMGKDLEIGVPRIPYLQLEKAIENGPNAIAGSKKGKFSQVNSKKDTEQAEGKQLELSSEKPNADLRNRAADFVGVTNNSTDSSIQSTVLDIPNGPSKFSDKKEKPIYDNSSPHSLELSLKTLRDAGDTGTSVLDRSVLSYSHQHSAFSRYNSASSANKAPAGNDGSCSPLDNGSEAAKIELIQNFQSNPNSTPPSQLSNGCSNNSEIGLTTNSAFTKLMVFNDKLAPKSTVKCAFQPEQPTIQGRTDASVANTILAHGRGMNQQVQVLHHLHCHVHNIPQQKLADNDDLLLKNMSATALQCGSSHVLSAPIDGNSGNHSLSGSTSRSNHGSNGQNGDSAALIVGGAKVESGNGVSMKVGQAGSIGYESSNGVDKNRFAQREAALKKFRKKRKERCFEKKVRYQSRKKLAEQRPRIRGQFVQQMALEIKDKDRDS